MICREFFCRIGLMFGDVVNDFRCMVMVVGCFSWCVVWVVCGWGLIVVWDCVVVGVGCWSVIVEYV